MSYSFDVFDTVVTRSVSRPSVIFLLAGRNAPDPMTPVEFAAVRVAAERAAEEKAPGRQATFDGIYKELSQLTGWNDERLGVVKAAELDLEISLSHGLPETLLAIKNVRRSGDSVLFISDMYLPSDAIITLLIKSGAWEEGDRLYVSCECRTSKREGGLFRHVLNEEGLRPEELIHCGDNELGDVQRARENGVQAKLVRPAAINSYEQVLDRYCDVTMGISALLAGNGCVARLHALSSDDHARALEAVACSVAAPILTAFAGWILNEASRRGIRRLYFVSRDGYVIKDFAEALAATMDCPPEIRYLYGSRQAWRSVAMTHAGVVDFSWAFEATASVTVSVVFERLGTSPSVAEALLELWGYAAADWSRALSLDELRDLKEHFESSDEVRTRIAAAVSSRKDAALAYLKQEGLFDDSSWALVDLGWHGSLQTTLSSLLRENGGSCELGLYFGLRSRGPTGPTNDQCAAYAFDVDREGSEVPVPDLLYLMESFCTAPHGTCTRYEFSDGRYRPVFRDGHGPELAEWGLDSVHAAYRRYLDLLAVECLPKFNWSVLKDPVVELLREFSVNPEIAEARAWGRFPYENDQNAAASHPLAVGKVANWQALVYCMKVGELPHTFIEWQGGAWSQTSPLARWCLQGARTLGRLKRSLTRFYRKSR